MRKRFLSALVASVLSLVAFSSTTSAQSQAQGFSDELEAFVTMPDGSMWLSTVALKSQLELATGLQATVARASSAIGGIDHSGGGRYVRCENCQPIPGSAFAQALLANGYTVQTDGFAGALPGASDGWVKFTGP